MKQYVRREQGKFIGLTAPVFTHEAPTTMRFGDDPEEGANATVARADHRHGMPPGPYAIIEAFARTAFGFSDMMWQDAAGPFTDPYDGVTGAVGSGATFGTSDDPTASGGFGTVQIGTGIANANQAGGFVAIMQPSDTADALNHAPRRVRTFQCRARFARTSGAAEAGVPTLTRCVVGGIRSNQSNTTRLWLSNIDDGIYFYSDVAADNEARWIAATTASGQSTIVDTGVSMVEHASVVDFQMFEIRFDGTTLTYLIDEVEVATITDNIPTDSIAGWGAWLEHVPRTDTNKVVVDSIMMLGSRV